MKLIKIIGVHLLILGFLGVAKSFAYTSVANWNTIGDGWSCVNRTASGQFTDTHYAIDGSSGTPDPSNALKITYPNGWPDAREPAHCWKSLGGQYEDIYVEYYFKYSSGYQFHPVDNKQTYYWLSSSSANWYISVGGSRKVSVVTQTYSTARYGSNTGYDPVIAPGIWYKVTARFKMNTPGVSNGICQLWINDQLVINSTNVGYRSSSQSGLGMSEATITPVFGGVSGVYKTHVDYQWYDKFIISTTKPDTKSVSSTPELIPNPPGIKSIE